MRVTKFVHSCLLVEAAGRTALFDPGEMSAPLLAAHTFERLDNIVVTHEHADHFHLPTVQALVTKFPGVTVTVPKALVGHLADAGIQATHEGSDGVKLFAAPWGSTDRAVQLALELRPRYIIPIHDWHWRDEVRVAMYDRLEQLFAAENIMFFKPVDGEPFTVSVLEESA